MKNLLSIIVVMLFAFHSFGQDVDADDKVNITQVNSKFIGVYANAYNGIEPGGFPLFQLNNYGGTPSSILPTVTNSVLGTFQFSGHNGSTRNIVAELKVKALSDFDIERSTQMEFSIGPNKQRRMTIMGDTGFIGMGTAAPTQRVDVNGRIRMRSGAMAGYIPVSDADGVMTWTDPSTILTGSGGSSLWAESGSDINRLTGEVGIGTDVTDAKLHVEVQNTEGTLNVIKAESNYSGNADVRAVEGLSVTNPGYGIGGYFTGGYRGAYIFNNATTYTGTSYGAYMAATGEAGTRYAAYGTASNAGGSAAYGGYFRGESATNNYGVYALASGGTNSYGVYALASGGTNSYGIYATTSNNAANNYAGYFNGQTVINTDAGNLEIRDESTDKGIYFDGENNGDNVTIKSLEDDNDLLSISTDVERVGINTLPYFTFDIHHELGVPSNGEVPIVDTGTGNYNGLNIHNTYNGLTDNHWTMYVYSDARLALFRDGIQMGQFNATTGAYTTTSDRKLKKDIKELDSQMEKIMELKPSTYVYKRDKEGITRYGLIAQEVHKIYPELAPLMTNKVDGDKEEIRGVTYSEFVPVLIAGLQEQYGKVKEGEEEIEELKTTNDELKSEVVELKQQLEDLADLVNTKFNQMEEDMSSCCFEGTDSRRDAGNMNVDLNGSDIPSLEQNAPNPFYEQTIIKYYIPSYAKNAVMTITDIKGSPLKSVNLEGTGLGTVTVNANELPVGTYTYTLFVDGKRVESKQMILVK